MEKKKKDRQRTYLKAVHIDKLGDLFGTVLSKGRIKLLKMGNI